MENLPLCLGAALRKGNTKSCGCQKYSGFNGGGQQPSIKIGDKFGKLTIIEDMGLKPYYNTGKNRRWYKCRCECGNIVEGWGNAIKSGIKNSCGCLASKGELKIEKILKENHINYKKEIIDERLVQQYNRKLRFDFGIYDNYNNLIKYIEFDGRQHEEGMDSGVWSKSESLEKIKERDEIKNKFCKENNILLTRIPYTKLKNLKIKDLI